MVAVGLYVALQAKPGKEDVGTISPPGSGPSLGAAGQ